LARLDLRNGHLAWTNAGHPLPLLVRGGRVVRHLDCRPSLPWGLGGPLVEEAQLELEPGDTVVFYSDGVVDGRAADDSPFGIDRFVDLVEEAFTARAVPDLVLRHAIQEVSDFQSNHLQDDATIVLLEWRPGP
jgi:serine phosphatase RsbU (regulator of sigma subunit)